MHAGCSARSPRAHTANCASRSTAPCAPWIASCAARMPRRRPTRIPRWCRATQCGRSCTATPPSHWRERSTRKPPTRWQATCSPRCSGSSMYTPAIGGNRRRLHVVAAQPHSPAPPEGAAAVQRWRLDLHDRSNASLRGYPDWSMYAASKAVLPAYARVWVSELRDRRIRVNVLTPGQVATPMMEEVIAAEMKAQFESVIPRREMGRPEEIASVALFLASDDSSYVNGMELVVDGGTTVI